MHTFIQENKKVLLIILVVLLSVLLLTLMIVFFVPLPTSFKHNLTRGDLAIGTVDGEKITGNELGQARLDLELLRQNEFLPLLELGGSPENRGEISVFAKYFQGDDGALAYLLLQKEAEKQGFSVSRKMAEGVAAAAFKNVNVTPDTMQLLVPAVRRFMLVQGAFERASASVKVSKPLNQYFIAQALQGLTLNLVEYNAADMEKSVPVPTAEQVRQQYYKYGDSLPSKQSFMATKPSTPGYKVPDRIKLQYVELPHAAVIESALSELSSDERFQLDLEAFRYYQQHADEFQARPTRPAPPTTKPFTEVKLELRQRLLADPAVSSADLVVVLRAKVAAREKELQNALHDELDHDFVEWTAAHAGIAHDAQPAVPSTSPMAAIYPDLGFLTGFANTFEAKYKVRLMVDSLGERWLSQDDLRALPDLESARAGDVPFAEYAMRDLAPDPTIHPAFQPIGPPIPSTTEPTTNPAQPSAESLSSWHPIGTGLGPFQPSALLQDSAGNSFIFRLTAFEPAHEPPLADVESTIVEQLKSAGAYRLARDEAAKLLTNAQLESKLQKEHNLPDLQGLSGAARASGRRLIEAGPFRARELFRDQSVRGYSPVDVIDKFMFIKAVSDLAKLQTADNPHPSTLIELPTERKILVAEMGDAVIPVPADEMFAVGQLVVPKIRKTLEQGQFTGPSAAAGSDFVDDWFDMNHVIARVKYVKAR